MTFAPLLSPVRHVVDAQKVYEWVSQETEEHIFTHLKQVLYDFFNFSGFDFFQNICS